MDFREYMFYLLDEVQSSTVDIYQSFRNRKLKNFMTALFFFFLPLMETKSNTDLTFSFGEQYLS